MDDLVWAFPTQGPTKLPRPFMTTPSKDSPSRKRLAYDSQEQEAYLHLWRTYDRLKAIEDRLFGQHGLTAQQYNALRLLAARHPQSLATLELAGKLVSRAPDITRLINHLEEKGWVVRSRPETNRRQVLVAITEAGRSLLRQLEEPVRKCATSQLGHLTAPELTMLIEILKRARQPHEEDGSPWATPTN